VQPGSFKDIDSTLDVDALIKSRFFEAGPNAGTRGEMDDLVELRTQK
jgi:hypothetical protein